MSPNEKKSPIDQALDLLVYAPLGLALSARELVPKLAEKGRNQLSGQVATARVVGQFAVQQGQVEAAKLVDRARTQVEDVLADVSGGRRPSEAPRRRQPPSEVPSEGPATQPAAPAVAEQGSGAKPSAPTAASLAIPDYDSLSASQVVPRLAGLSAAELERVRRYEEAHRGRKTILNRVSQLQATA